MLLWDCSIDASVTTADRFVIVLESPTVPGWKLYLHVPRGYERWTIQPTEAYLFTDRREAQKVADLLIKDYGGKGIISVKDWNQIQIQKGGGKSG